MVPAPPPGPRGQLSYRPGPAAEDTRPGHGSNVASLRKRELSGASVAGKAQDTVVGHNSLPPCEVTATAGFELY